MASFYKRKRKTFKKLFIFANENTIVKDKFRADVDTEVTTFSVVDKTSDEVTIEGATVSILVAVDKPSIEAAAKNIAVGVSAVVDELGIDAALEDIAADTLPEHIELVLSEVMIDALQLSS